MSPTTEASGMRSRAWKRDDLRKSSSSEKRQVSTTKRKTGGGEEDEEEEERYSTVVELGKSSGGRLVSEIEE